MAGMSIALNRFGLGARPDDSLGDEPRAWLVQQLERYVAAPPPMTGQPASGTLVAQFAAYRAQISQLRKTAGPSAPPPSIPSRPAAAMAPPVPQPPIVQTGDDPAEALRKQFAQQSRALYNGAVTARALAALQSPAPFAERLVHFWANHFALSGDKMEVTNLAGAFEFEAIRPHVMGSFRDMLFAVERHPAMLLFLDQAVSVGPNSPLAVRAANRPNVRRNLGLNENLAREILELHTLGVRTGYSQADVTEFARAMTGWTVAGFGRGPVAKFTGASGRPGDFVFADALHEPGTRTILGQPWPQAGEAQAAAVLDHLATHPATARHIATKLARHFAGDDPPPKLVARLEANFSKTGGDLPSLYRTLTASPECWAPGTVKFKSPWEWSISAMRALGTRQLQPNAMPGLMNQLGQPVWKPGSPAGWDDVTGAWAGPDAVLRRVEAAERMAQRTRDQIDPRARAAAMFPEALSPATTQAIARAESNSQGVALLLVAPEFLRR
ncbi:DUF1800 domain-containing protein [Sphingomonas sp. ABOLE]|uniref:DUF1800 domain-containing protein n=1 Tax=Sphingomonas sp. ABOLE TaxID=1985878 RepID=UPI000F7DA7D6|nr:DUF1800 domain-containing protein [Sphingomonas sp. ABOLE]RSV39569.1 DUF1800 domain-containing protein [Sphingomonas sp. ABOLE]